MKRILASLVLLITCQIAWAQESFSDHKKAENTTREAVGFDASKIFAGGGISLGYGSTVDGNNETNTTFNIGAIPEIGYNLSNIFDIGLASSINYYSTTSTYNISAKYRNINYSLGAFVRIHPIDDFFIQVMPEKDWIRQKQITSDYTTIYKIQSNSFLVGIGYGHRIIGESYFYSLVMLDLEKDRYSPYNYVDANGTVSPLPVIRGGFNFYPFRKKQK